MNFDETFCKSLSKSLHIKEKIVEKYIDLDWDWDLLFHNKSISDEFIKKYSYKFQGLTINGNTVVPKKDYNMKDYNVKDYKNYKALTPFTDFTEIMEFPFPIWDWDWLSQNTSIPFIIKYKKLIWNWNIVTRRVDLASINEYILSSIKCYCLFSCECVLKEWDWDWSYINNEYLSLENIKRYPKLTWDYYECTQFNDYEFINKNHFLDWNWDIIKKNLLLLETEIQKKYLVDYPNLRWNWQRLSERMDLEFINNNNKLKWNWYIINSNIYVKFKYTYYKKQQRKRKKIICEFCEGRDNDNDNYTCDSKCNNDNCIYNIGNCDNIENLDLSDLYKKYPNLQLDWFKLTRCFSFEFIKDHPWENWDFYDVAYNTIDMENTRDTNFIKNKLHKHWNWQKLSSIVSLNFIKDNKDNKDCKWHFKILNKRFNIKLLDEIFLTNTTTNTNTNTIDTFSFNDSCLICLEEFEDPEIENDLVYNSVILECKHKYHTECLFKCVSKKCPLCNKKFDIMENRYLKWRNAFYKKALVRS